MSSTPSSSEAGLSEALCVSDSIERAAKFLKMSMSILVTGIRKECLGLQHKYCSVEGGLKIGRLATITGTVASKDVSKETALFFRLLASTAALLLSWGFSAKSANLPIAGLCTY